MKTTTLLRLKDDVDASEIEYDTVPISEALISPGRTEIQIAVTNELKKIDTRININQEKISSLDFEIDQLASHADSFDYTLAVASGILSGLIDSFFVGDFSLDRGKKWGADTVNSFVLNVAQSTGYTGNNLHGAIVHLEAAFPLASDSVTSDFGGGLQHHLRDFSHHPTPAGLAFSVLTQFTENAYGTDTAGVFKVVSVRDKSYIGVDIPQKILFGCIYWFFHMVSDIAGSQSTPGAGTGLPGPLLSLAKEMSVLPFFRDIKINNIEFSTWLSKLFNGTLIGKRDANGKVIEAVRFDLRAELGVVYEMGKQTLPIIINECLIRGFYFIRRFCNELKSNNVKSLKEIEKIRWNEVLPFRNRTIARMLTISSGTFVVVDVIDAAARATAKSNGVHPLFWGKFALRINVAGVGRFVVACGADVYMGIGREKLRNEQISMYTEQLHLYNAKVFYKQTNMWISAKDAGLAIQETYQSMDQAFCYLFESMKASENSLNKIKNHFNWFKKKNRGVIKEILEEL